MGNDLLSDFTESEPSEQKSIPYSHSSAYDTGALFAGMNTTDHSVKDFSIKFVNLLTSLAKNGAKTSTESQKVFDLMKIAFDLYLDTLKIKQDDKNSNKAILFSIQGFVDNYSKTLEE